MILLELNFNKKMELEVISSYFLVMSIITMEKFSQDAKISSGTLWNSRLNMIALKTNTKSGNTS